MPRRARRPFPRARLVLFLVAALLPLGLAPQALGKKKPAAAPPVVLSEHEALERIVGAGLSSDEPYQALADLCDSVGHRLSGSVGMERAVVWAQARMREFGLANVRAEEVMVPVWQRGEEHLFLVEPAARELSMLGLGNSVGTPPEGITAELVVVSSFAELEGLPDEKIRGRGVVFDAPFKGYGETVGYRAVGASVAAKRGAVFALVRSIGPISYDTPHTGGVFYRPDLPKIPAAAITIEAATQLHRLAAAGPVRARLRMDARFLADAPSANVVAEVRGRERPDEIVLLGAHLDSWDVGQGAEDDGAGVMTVIGAARLIARLPTPPRRTVRVVLYAKGAGRAP